MLDSVYADGKEAISGALRSLIDTAPFVVPERVAVLSALDAYEAGPADFSDYLITSLAEERGASALLTFDRRLLRDPRLSDREQLARQEPTTGDCTCLVSSTA